MLDEWVIEEIRKREEERRRESERPRIEIPAPLPTPRRRDGGEKKPGGTVIEIQV